MNRALLLPRLREARASGANKTTAVLSEPPPPLDFIPAYMPLVHFLAAASHCMPAFLQAASVFGVPANAGALKATTRLKARIETNAFMIVSSDLGTTALGAQKAAPCS